MAELTVSGNEAELQAEIVRLNKIVTALMNHAEREAGTRQGNFGLFQNAVMLENQVRRRTAELEAALRENERINRDLTREREEQRALIRQLEEAHNQLLQSEKLASIGQLAAGVAHEVNNPIGFVNSNLCTLKKYVADLLELNAAYERLEPELSAIAGEQIKALKARSTARRVSGASFRICGIFPGPGIRNGIPSMCMPVWKVRSTWCGTKSSTRPRSNAITATCRRSTVCRRN